MMNYLQSDSIIEKKIYIGEIPAILFTPKEKEGLLPTIIFYHGWTSRKEFQRMRAFIFASVGYQVLIPDAIYHGERNPIDYRENSGEYFWKTIFKNLDESDSIIDELVSKYNADPYRIGVAGNSMGGFTSSGIFTHNPKIKALVVLNGSCDWQDFNEMLKKYFSIAMTDKLKKIEERVNKVNPVNNLHLLNNRPILMLHGKDDKTVPAISQKNFYDKAKPYYKNKDNIKLIQYHDLNHFVTTNMMEESIIWFKTHL